MTGSPPLPRKTREVRNHHISSLVWNDFRLRDDDVIVGSYAKSGTTWIQQIVAQFVFDGAPDIPINEISLWLDSRVNPRVSLATLEAQAHRRIIKTHLPLDALPYCKAVKYIYVARDGRDVAWSLHHFLTNATDLYYRTFNQTPGRVGPPLERPDPDVRRYFGRWLKEDGHPVWPFWDHIRSWWRWRDVPNILLVHFNDLERDLEGEMRRIASFLGYDIAEDRWPVMIEHCTFDYMKAHADKAAPARGSYLKGGARQFIREGGSGGWRSALTADDSADYERIARAQLGEECANWLARGANA